jgi:hypothetical protein
VLHARRLAAALIAALTLLAVGATRAGATPLQALTKDQILDRLGRQASSTAELKQQIALQLRYTPGGAQTAPNEVSYDGGKFVVTYAMPGAAGALGNPDDCPFDWFCFYDNYEFGYPRGKLSSCGWQDLSKYKWNDRTASVHNAVDDMVDFYNHQDYGHPEYAHALDEYLFTALEYGRIPYVDYPDQADHVIRRC